MSRLRAATATSSTLKSISVKLYSLNSLQMKGPGYTTSQVITAKRTSSRQRKITGKTRRKTRNNSDFRVLNLASVLSFTSNIRVNKADNYD